MSGDCVTEHLLNIVEQIKMGSLMNDMWMRSIEEVCIQEDLFLRSGISLFEKGL